MEGQYAETGQQTKQRAEEFLIKEGVLIFWGMTLLAVMLVSLAVYQSLEPSSLIFERNAFGEGEKEVSLILQSEEQRKEYSLTLGERSLSREEEDALKEKFFGELEEQMAGENTSLHSVDQKLCFEDGLPSWPFTITYGRYGVCASGRQSGREGRQSDRGRRSHHKDRCDSGVRGLCLEERLRHTAGSGKEEGTGVTVCQDRPSAQTGGERDER